MTALEEQLTNALERLSEQYEMEQQRHAEQVGTLGRQVETLQRHVERQAEQSEALQRHVERLSRQVTSLAEYYGTHPGTSRGRWR